jgi:hypothetical protein
MTINCANVNSNGVILRKDLRQYDPKSKVKLMYDTQSGGA